LTVTLTFGVAELVPAVIVILGENAVLSTLIIPFASVTEDTNSPFTAVSAASSALIALEIEVATNLGVAARFSTVDEAVLDNLVTPYTLVLAVVID